MHHIKRSVEPRSKGISMKASKTLFIPKNRSVKSAVKIPFNIKRPIEILLFLASFFGVPNTIIIEMTISV